jgi:anaerobic magnesium-protoporphyrin IX monomethyl ester cyclase
LKTINANWFINLCATPLIGSEMLEICLENDYIKGSYIDCDYKKPIVETEDFTPEYIQEQAYSMNLELNFVENSDMRLGDYDTALKGLENAIRAKSDHAFGYYYASQCCDKLGQREKAKQYLTTAKSIFEDNSFWRGYKNKFNISI